MHLILIIENVILTYSKPKQEGISVEECGQTQLPAHLTQSDAECIFRVCAYDGVPHTTGKP